LLLSLVGLVILVAYIISDLHEMNSREPHHDSMKGSFYEISNRKD
jgi:hypothetical protein